MGADQEEARILIAAIVERIEAARDERVLDGSHRDQPRTEMGGCKPQRGEHQVEVVLGNAKLDMLSRLMRYPFLHRRDFRLVIHVRTLLSPEEAMLLDDSAQVYGLGVLRRVANNPVGQRNS